MEYDEFKRWFNDYAVSFPNIRAYLSRLPGDTQEATFTSWYETLKRYDVVYLVMVKDGMVYGTLDPLQPTDSGLFAHHIRAYIRTMITEQIRERDRRNQQARAPSLTCYIESDDSTCSLYKWGCAARVFAKRFGWTPIDTDALSKAVITLRDETSTAAERQQAETDLGRMNVTLETVQGYLDSAFQDVLNREIEDDEAGPPRVEGVRKDVDGEGAATLKHVDRADDTGEAAASRVEEVDPPEEPFDW